MLFFFLVARPLPPPSPVSGRATKKKYFFLWHALQNININKFNQEIMNPDFFVKFLFNAAKKEYMIYINIGKKSVEVLLFKDT